MADLLVAADIERSLIVIQGKSDASPVQPAQAALQRVPAALKDCLAPNRRVEVELRGQRLR